MAHPKEHPIDELELLHPPLLEDASLKGSTLLGSVGARRAMKWAALGLILAMVVVASGVFGGETPTACQQAYLVSGLPEQQMSFADFSRPYSDTFCAPGGGAD
jgi:hypothetical protein